MVEAEQAGARRLPLHNHDDVVETPPEARRDLAQSPRDQGIEIASPHVTG
jgi:hypothetical protein